MVALTLLRQHNPLAEPANQLRALAPKAEHKKFEDSLADSGLSPLRATSIQVLQVNVG